MNIIFKKFDLSKAHSAQLGDKVLKNLTFFSVFNSDIKFIFIKELIT